MTSNILMILTNHETITDEHKTGLWLEEFAVPYLKFQEQGYDVKVTSIEGGKVPLDPNSIEDRPEWEAAESALENTEQLSKADANAFDGVFLPGGHGTMFDFPDHETLQYVLQEFAEKEKVIGSVCHGPAGLVNVTFKDGTPIIKGKNITAFTDEEEKEMQLDQHMPFMLESKLREQGASFERGDKWSDYSVRDHNIVTGQNPQSSGSAADRFIRAIEAQAVS